MKTIDEVRGQRTSTSMEDPPFARWLFQSTGPGIGLLWLGVRIWAGWVWLSSGWSGLDRQPDSAALILGYWRDALRTTGQAQVADADVWRLPVLQALVDGHAEEWLPRLIGFLEVLVGLGVILGVLVGIAAAAGLALMVIETVLEGWSGGDPLLLVPALLLILAWKNAGYFGLDRFVLRLLGAPWWSAYVAAPGSRPARVAEHRR